MARIRFIFLFTVITALCFASCRGLVRNDYPPQAAYYLFVQDKNLHTNARDDAYLEKLKERVARSQPEKKKPTI